MNAFLLILLLIGGVLVLFIPMIMSKATDTTMKISGRKVFIYKEPSFKETEEGKQLSMIVEILKSEEYGPYSKYGLSEIRNWMKSGIIRDYMQTREYTDENIKSMLKWIGVEENEYTRRDNRKIEIATIPGVTDVDFSYEDTEEGQALLEIVEMLKDEEYGPYSSCGLIQITKLMKEKVPEEKRIMTYTKDNIEIMLSAAGIRKNDVTKRDYREIPDLTIDL